MAKKSGGIREWIIPFAFALCAGWVIWHGPAYILDFFPHANESMTAQITELHERKDVSPGLPGMFGGIMDFVDWTALLLLPVILVLGMRNVVHAHMEYPDYTRFDLFALFLGRVTMILIISMTLVMLYEVFLRYVIEAPTLWANELTLWIAGFVFLISGIYAMQQRCHIRIFILYDIFPRPIRKACDVLSTVLLCLFAFFLVFGSYKQVFGIKFHRWEMFGTAFDPPIPATIQPAILVVVCLVALQAVLNLIADWHQNPDDIPDELVDEEELEAIKKSVGSS
ncbi:trap dicarboxylate transporter, dctq subunit [Roseibium sp. TrichSKD4]|uniref:TRAP transporter small permease subunit n=1 Tax=Roseibium sp. TrichSKD4 TaxID=744980 RepID=UPI0001E56FAD|nr:TRAP transporter small permease [Roseibium sp. TrichSKD4]EFO32091.1 trap dicarboxylate transporter, dctq subunit [Roseibium sp. TrichSKD4]